MKINLKKLARRAFEPTTIAGLGGGPLIAVAGSVLFPDKAAEINLATAVLAGVLIGHKPKKTFEAEADD